MKGSTNVAIAVFATMLAMFIEGCRLARENDALKQAHEREMHVTPHMTDEQIADHFR